MKREPANMLITPMREGTGGDRSIPAERLAQAVAILRACFRAPDGYPTLEAATEEMVDLSANAACLLAAVEGELVGLIGALPRYCGHAWELHPLAVRPDRQGRGIGQALVAALEAEARAADVSVIYLGTDDTTARTNLGGIDLFPGVLAQALRLESRADGPGGHPFTAAWVSRSWASSPTRTASAGRTYSWPSASRPDRKTIPDSYRQEVP